MVRVGPITEQAVNQCCSAVPIFHRSHGPTTLGGRQQRRHPVDRCHFQSLCWRGARRRREGAPYRLKCQGCISCDITLVPVPPQSAIKIQVIRGRVLMQIIMDSFLRPERKANSQTGNTAALLLTGDGRFVDFLPWILFRQTTGHTRSETVGQTQQGQTRAILLMTKMIRSSSTSNKSELKEYRLMTQYMQ